MIERLWDLERLLSLRRTLQVESSRARFPPIIVPTPVAEVFSGDSIYPDANAAITLEKDKIE